MSDATHTLSVHILDKKYQIKCPIDEVQSLQTSAQYLDAKLREIRSGGTIIGAERIAVMAALNITNELLSSKSKGDQYIDIMNDRISQLTKRVDSALEE